MLPRRTRRALQRRWKRSLAALALLLALGQAPALAATLTVTTTVPDIAADGQCSLIEAIDNANADNQTHGDCDPGSGPNTLDLSGAMGTHTLTAVHDSTYGPSGLPLISTTITIEGRGSTITRDSGAPDFRIVAVGVDGDLTLNETTVSGGKTGGGVNERGGGIANFGGTLTLTNSTVSGNSAGGSGGGVYMRGLHRDGVYNQTTLTNSTVSGSSAYLGGGVSANQGTLTLTNSTVSGNSGGGVSFVNEGTLTLTNSTVSGNSGGGVRLGASEDDIAIAILTNCTVSGNSGSGLAIGEDAIATVTNCTISGNSGGGVFVRGYYTSRALAILTNCTVSGNSSGFKGGGVYVGDYGRLGMVRTLVSGNTAPTGPEIASYSVRVSGNFNFNLFGHSGLTDALAFSNFVPGASDITATSDGTTPTALADILDTALMSNGGPTQTHALVTGSPAIDASPVDSDCQPTDQRGVSRPQGAACDIGAFELGPFSPVLCHGLVPTIIGTDADDTLTGTNGPDVIHGLGGNDTISGGNDNDVICGGEGADTVSGNNGIDRLFGENGTDTLKGNNGADALDGGANHDTCNGGRGADTGANCETQTRIP